MNADAAVRIATVDILGDDARELVAMKLGRPKPGDESDVFALDIRGWVVPRTTKAVAVEILSGDELVRETPVDMPQQIRRSRIASQPFAAESGFYVSLGALGLAPSFSLLLRARLEDDTRVDLARVTGRRASVEPAAAGLQPTLVSSPTGRTGTTWLVHLLGQHPELVAHPPFGVEPRLASYWLEVASALTEPASYKRTLRTQMDRPHWWLGAWDSASRGTISSEATHRLLGREQVTRVARFAGEQADHFYSSVAAEQGKENPRYFVEKAPYGLRRLELLNDIYPGLREVVLFRDPRDTVCSILSYSDRQARVALVDNDPQMQDEYLDSVRDSFLGLLDQTEARSPQALAVRYEDLTADSEGTLKRILEHLGVDSSPAAARAMLEGAAARGDELASSHRTTEENESSVERWRRDLEPELRRRTTEVFEPVLERLGYERDHGPEAREPFVSARGAE